MCKQKSGLKTLHLFSESECAHTEVTQRIRSVFGSPGDVVTTTFLLSHISHCHVPADRGAVTYHTPAAGKGVTWTGLIQSTLKKLIELISFNLAFGRRLWKFLQRRWHQLLSQLLCKSAAVQYLARVCMCVQVDIVNRLHLNQKQFIWSWRGGSSLRIGALSSRLEAMMEYINLMKQKDDQLWRANVTFKTNLLPGEFQVLACGTYSSC